MTGARISFGVFDETAAQTAVFSSSRGQPWVDYSSLTDGIYPDEDPSNPTLRQFVTGEPDMVRLDGTYRLFPDAPGASLGFWSSSLSGDDGAFSTVVVLSCVFDGTGHSSVGVTIHFGSGSVFKDFVVDWQNSVGGVVSTKQVQGNTKSTVYLSNNVDQYYGLRITCQATDAPCRYARIQEVEFGEKVIYDQASLVSASVVEEVDLSGASVPAGSLQFTALDPGGRLNPVNPDGIYNYLRKGIPINVEFLVGNAYYPGGVYYMDTWEGDNTGTAKFKAIDIIGFRSASKYASAFHGSTSPVGASVIFADIYQTCGLSGSVDTSVGSGTYIGYVPETDMQQALAHACLACGGYAKATRDGRVNILPPPVNKSPLSLDQMDILGEPDVFRTNQLTQIEVEEYEYVVSSEENLHEINWFGLGPEAENFRYTFDGVHCDYSVSIDMDIGYGPWEDWSLRSGYNFVDFYAKSLNDQLLMYIEVRAKTVTESKVVRRIDGGTISDGIVSVKGIPLITKEKTSSVVSRMKEHYAKRLTVKAHIVWRQGLECGACVSVPTRFGVVTGHITRMDIDLTGGLLATVEVLA